MSDAINPTNDSTDSPKPKRPVSETKRRSNRENAQHSTGPRTRPGKDSSRRNSLKHGHCAKVIDVPDEDPKLVARRYRAWRKELNPTGERVADYLVWRAAKKSVRLDRFDVVYDARVALLARDAWKMRSEQRHREVEELLRGPAENCDIAARRLKTTAEGCRAVLKEWRDLRRVLTGPVYWDRQDANWAKVLLGGGKPMRGAGPNSLIIPTDAIEKWRDVAKRLDENRPNNPDMNWKRKYTSPMFHDFDRDRLPELDAAARKSIAEILTIIDADIAELEALAEKHEAADALEMSEATFRLRFDASDEGRLLHRYELETERGLLKILATLAERVRAAAKYAQTSSTYRLADSIPDEEGDEEAPNEPTAAEVVERPRTVHGPDCTTVEMPITPRIERPDLQ